MISAFISLHTYIQSYTALKNISKLEWRVSLWLSYSRRLVKIDSWAHTHSCWLSKSGVRPEVGMSNKFPGDANAAGPETTFWGPVMWCLRSPWKQWRFEWIFFLFSSFPANHLIYLLVLKCPDFQLGHRTGADTSHPIRQVGCVTPYLRGLHH